MKSLINVDQAPRQRWLDNNRETLWAQWGKITAAVVLTILLEVLVGRI